ARRARRRARPHRRRNGTARARGLICGRGRPYDPGSCPRHRSSTPCAGCFATFAPHGRPASRRAGSRSGRGPPPARRPWPRGAAGVARARRVRAAAGQPTIAIVGAGIAGLACALDLADKGIASTVYEASGRVGGRMFSNDGGYWDAGQVSEWCGELIDTGHKTIRALAHRFGLPLDDLHAAETPGSTETYRFFGDFFPKTAADADFLEIDAALTADLKAAGFPTLFNSATAAGTALDHMSVF